ncbi:AraC family transcriptional regulator ligand-binding domain-containing protein [Streptomyces sp. NPDC057027]|uniref:AraC family transcriptional regulator ligand-binding domain-containing protein n=1 Tax=Streptomyces sp. NPDC057027 TaxID=3346004 RepID=UPI003630240F
MRPGDLDSDHGLLPTVTAGRILRSATTRLDCPDFALCLAASQDMSMLGPPAVAVGNCDTVGDGLDCASRFLFVHNRGLRLSRGPDPERYAGVGAVGYRLVHPDVPFEPQSMDAGLGLLYRKLITMSGGYELLGVYLPHLPLTDESVYTAFFGAPVRFNTDQALLRVPAKLFARPMSAPVNPELRHMAVEYLESHCVDPREGVAASVRSSVGRALGTVPVRIVTMPRIDLTWLRAIVSGAAPLDEEPGRALSPRLSVPVVQGYCMTELGPVSRIVPVADGGTSVAGRRVSVGASGRPLPNTVNRLVAPETGAEIAVPEDGRKGHQVASAEPEALLLAHPDVSDAAVIGVPTPRVRRSRRPSSSPAIPGSTVGKILRKELRAIQGP